VRTFTAGIARTPALAMIATPRLWMIVPNSDLLRATDLHWV
jgi:hypothetical protein